MALKITLMKSTIGRKDDHIATIHSLGLRKIGDVTVQPANPCTQGKINKVSYLINVEEISE